MKDRELKKLLMLNIPEIDMSKKTQTIQAAKQLLDSRGRHSHSTSLFQLITTQIGFIPARIWAAQIAIITLLGFLIAQNGTNVYSALTSITCMLPLISLIGVSELLKSFQHGLWEIEQSCRYNTKQILIIRLIIFGFSDLLITAVLITFLNLTFETGLIALSLYILVPFTITNMGFLLAFGQMRKQYTNYAIASLGAAFSGVFLLLTTNHTIYEKCFLWIWVLLLMISIAVITSILRNIMNTVMKGDILNWNL